MGKTHKVFFWRYAVTLVFNFLAQLAPACQNLQKKTFKKDSLRSLNVDAAHHVAYIGRSSGKLYIF